MVLKKIGRNAAFLAFSNHNRRSLVQKTTYINSVSGKFFIHMFPELLIQMLSLK